MTKLKIKGNELDIKFTTTSFSRYAILFRNKIISSLKKIGISEGYIRLKEEAFPIRKAAAEVTWYFNNFNCYYSYNRQERYIDNLHVIALLLDLEVTKVLDGIKTVEEFITDFRGDDDLAEKRKEARELLHVDEHETNLEVIDKQFKQMAKEFHPDMINGSAEQFKKLNEAHKLLRKELE